MIDPVTIGLAIQGVKLVVTGIKEAAAMAKEAFDQVKECADAGQDLASSMAPLTKFFSAAGKYESNRTQLEESKAAQEEAKDRGEPVADYVSDAEYVMEMMAIDRQVKQYYDNIKHIMIYNFNESGMWDEFWGRLSSLRAEREAKAEAKRLAETEKRLDKVRAELVKKRAKAKRIEELQTIAATIIIVVIFCGFSYGIWWMFQQGK